mgnify:CR=1 FL=1
MKSKLNPRRRLMVGTAFAALSIAATATPALAVVPNEDKTPADIVDNANEYRGVGMFFRADGFVCSGTLINPRTVLFAAHCVNDLPEEAYNADDIPAAWSFNVNALPGFQNWFANNFASNPDLAVFNVNRIFYDPRSLQNPQAGGFIEGDIALASLDTPAAGGDNLACTIPAHGRSGAARRFRQRRNFTNVSNASPVASANAPPARCFTASGSGASPAARPSMKGAMTRKSGSLVNPCSSSAPVTSDE